MNTLFTGLFTLECFLKLHAYGSRVRFEMLKQACERDACVPKQPALYSIPARQCDSRLLLVMHVEVVKGDKYTHTSQSKL